MNLFSARLFKQRYDWSHGVATDDRVIDKNDAFAAEVLTKGTELLGNGKLPETGAGLDEGAAHVAVLTQHLSK